MVRVALADCSPTTTAPSEFQTAFVPLIVSDAVLPPVAETKSRSPWLTIVAPLISVTAPSSPMPLAASRNVPEPSNQLLLPPNAMLPMVPTPLMAPPPDVKSATSEASGARFAGSMPLLVSLQLPAVKMLLSSVPTHVNTRGGGWTLMVLVTGPDVAVPSLITQVMVRVSWLVALVGSIAPESKATDRSTC